LVVCAYMCAILLVIDSLRYSWKRFHSSWVSAGHRHVPVFRNLGSGAWQIEFSSLLPKKFPSRLVSEILWERKIVRVLAS